MKNTLARMAAVALAVPFTAPFALPALAAGVLSHPAGFITIEIQPRGESLLAQPFDPFASGINQVLAGPFSPGGKYTLRKWNPAILAYDEAFRNHDSGIPGLAGQWWSNPAKPEASAMTLELAEGFFLKNDAATPLAVILSGWLNLSASTTLPLHPGPNLFGYPYFAEPALAGTRLAAAGSEGDIITAEGDPRTRYLLADGAWVTGAGTGLTFRTGIGYWYQCNADTTIEWNEPRPFQTSLPANLADPAILAIHAAGGTATLTLAAAPGARLDLFAKSGAINDKAPWTTVARSLTADGSGIIQVTDSQAGSARLYIAACALTDSDRDGTTDAMALLGIQADQPRTARPATKTSSDGTVDASFSGAYYVDAVTGSDANDGFTPATARASINATIALATTGNVIYVATGEYHEGAVVLPAGMKMVSVGRVVLL